MSNKTKASGARRRHVPQHRREPSWTIGDLAPSGLGTKIVVASVAGAALAIPATQAFASPASPASIAMKPGSGLITLNPAASQPAAFVAHSSAPAAGNVQRHTGAGTQHHAPQPGGVIHQQHATGHNRALEQQQPPEHDWAPQRSHPSPHQPGASAQPMSGNMNGATGGPVNSSGHSASGTATADPANGAGPAVPANEAGPATDPATQTSDGHGLLLEPDGTMLTLPKGASNVRVVPAGSLIIMPSGTMLRPLNGTYATIYGLITVSPPAANPGGLMQPLQAQMAQQMAQQMTQSQQAQQPAAAQAVTPAPAAAQAVTPQPAAAQAVTAAPAATRAVTAPPAAKPPVQVTSATAGLTVAGDGTLTPTGTANLAFPASGIGGSLPLSLPAANLAQSGQPAQLVFPAAEQNAALNDPVVQGLIENLSQQAQPSVPLPAPIPNLFQDTAPATAPAANPIASTGAPVQLASLGNVLSDAVQPGAFMLAGQPAGGGGLADVSPSAAVPPPAQSPITVSPPSLPSAPAQGYLRVWDPATNTYTDYPKAATGDVPVTPNSIYIEDNGGLYVPQQVQPGDHVAIPAAQGLNFYVPQDYVAPVAPLKTITPDNGTGIPSLTGSVPQIPQGTIDQATQDLLNQEQQAPPVEPPPTGPPVPTNFLAPAAGNTMPDQAPSAGTQLAANNVGANGGQIASDAGQLPAGSFQTAADNVIMPGQGSILIVQPSFFGTTIKPLDPGTDTTLSDGTRIQVTHDNFLAITPPGEDTREIAPGNTYTLPDGNQIMVPTTPPVVIHDPGNGDAVLQPGFHVTTNDGSTIEVTRDGVLRVTNPDGQAADYAPGSTYTLPAGTSISVMTPPQALNMDQNPATQFGSAPATGNQVAVNNADPAAQAPPAPQPSAQDAAPPPAANSAQPPADTAQPPADTAQPPADATPPPAAAQPSATDAAQPTAQPPADANATPAPVPASVSAPAPAPAPAPADVTQPPAASAPPTVADTAPPPVDTAPPPVDTAPPPVDPTPQQVALNNSGTSGLTSTDLGTGSDPAGGYTGGGFSGGGFSGGGSG